MIVGRQIVGVNVACWYISLQGPSHRALFSERNRIRTRVIPVGRGWRIVVRPRLTAVPA